MKVIPPTANDSALGDTDSISLGCSVDDINPGGALDLSTTFVVVERGSCARVAKAIFAQQAGAAGVIMINNDTGYPPYEGTITHDPDPPGAPLYGGFDYPVTIPFLGVQGDATPSSSAAGAALIAADGGTLTLAATTIDNPTYLTLAGFSSYGPATGTSALKPDVTAPGVSIESAGIGSGTLSGVLSGTSQATPHVSGLAALVKQAHPDWRRVAYWKAAIANTGDPNNVADYSILGAGTGLVQAQAATQTQVVALGEHETASLSFGFDELSRDYNKTDTITLRNFGSSPATFAVSAGSDEGVPHSVSLSSSSLTVPPHDERHVRVRLTVPAATAGSGIFPGTGAQFGEAAGIVTFSPSSGSNNGVSLQVPYVMVPQATSNVDVRVSEHDLRRTNTATATVTNRHGAIPGTADWYAWGLIDRRDRGLGSDDLRAAGVQTFPDFGLMAFGIATQTHWSNAAQNEFDVFVDANNDGTADYDVFAVDYGAVTTGEFDGITGVFTLTLDGPDAGTVTFAGFLAGATDSSTMTLPVYFSQLCGPDQPADLCVTSSNPAVLVHGPVVRAHGQHDGRLHGQREVQRVQPRDQHRHVRHRRARRHGERDDHRRPDRARADPGARRDGDQHRERERRRGGEPDQARRRQVALVRLPARSDPSAPRARARPRPRTPLGRDREALAEGRRRAALSRCAAGLDTGRERDQAATCAPPGVGRVPWRFRRSRLTGPRPRSEGSTVRPRHTRGVLAAVVATAAVALVGASASAAGNGDWTYVGTPPSMQGPALSTLAGPQLPGLGNDCTAVFGTSFTLGCYDPAEMRNAYDVPSSLTGAGQTIVIVDAYGDPTIEQDLAAFDGLFGLPEPPSFTIVHGSNTRNAGPHDASGWALETALDVEWAHAIAPGAAIVLAEAPSSSGNAINSTEKKVVSKYPGSVVSQSFGINENAIAGNGNNIQVKQADQNFQDFAAAGDTVVASAGDLGATAGTAANTASFPSSDPWVVSVGGTQGDPYPLGLCPSSGTDACTYGAEQVWNEPDFGAATGGAPSQIFTAPGYQAGITGSDARTTPDVAYNAAINGGVLVVQGPNIYLVGGTSCGAPQWAGIFALANEARASAGKGPLGAANPALYAIAQSHAADFHDIQAGENTLVGAPVPGFQARPGYDLATGLGTPDVASLVADLAAS